MTESRKEDPEVKSPRTATIVMCIHHSESAIHVVVAC